MTTALITGANRGIGLSLVRALVDRGLFIFAGARRPDDAQDLQRLMGDHPDRLQIVQLDVTSDDSVRSAADAVRENGSRLDVLVNNAGVLLEDPGTAFADLDVHLFAPTFTVNVIGTARVTQTMLPLLLASESPRIVNISSGAGSIGDMMDERYYCYGPSKAALNHLTVSLAHELRSRKVIVVAMSPGWVQTDMGGQGAELSPEESAEAIAETVLRLTLDDSGRFLGRSGSRSDYQW